MLLTTRGQAITFRTRAISALHADPESDRSSVAAAGRQHNLASTAAKIRAALTSEQLTARPGVIEFNSTLT